MSVKNTSLNGVAHNPRDPMHKIAPKTATELTAEFGRLAHNASMENVIDAAGSLIITALRQRFETKREAEAAIDEIFGRMKAALLAHYDGTSGRKKGIFPYDQTIAPGLIVNKSKIIAN